MDGIGIVISAVVVAVVCGIIAVRLAVSPIRIDMLADQVASQSQRLQQSVVEQNLELVDAIRTNATLRATIAEMQSHIDKLETRLIEAGYEVPPRKYDA